MNTKEYKCNLCAHRCGVDRRSTVGICGVTDKLRVARAALHMWEEPPISGTIGSGAIFFSGCSLGCVFCQNREISRGRYGEEISVERLSQIMLEHQARGAHNVNLVTPTHYVPQIKEALLMAKSAGLTLPIVYNTASYDTTEALRILDGLVDVYLPDLKYYRSETAKILSSAPDYPEVARAAIDEMVRQTPKPVFDGQGIMKKGTVVRILLLPGHVAEAKLTVKYLLDKYGDSIYISLMNQYTPMAGMTSPLNRAVTRDEYRQLVDYAIKLGLKNGFTQEFGTAKESFIPPFDGSGVL